jgi:cell division protein FtsI/penicillin-binding protein 2
MLRRELLATLSACALGHAHGSASLEPFFESREGAGILLDVRTRRPIAIHAAAVASRFLAPPGSTLKPFVLAALLRSGKLTATEGLLCPGRLTIAGRSFDCSHPRMDSPMRVETALAYSCNCFVARVAERFAPGELAGELARAGRIRQATGRDAVRLLALGEDGILTTAAELAMAYRSLALLAGRAEMQPIVAGMEGAVEYGTGQRARVAGAKVAGKTGSVRTEAGAPIAWFAGFLPSRAPEVVVTVMLQGHSGGSDAAPVAGRILEAYRLGRL